MRRLTPIVVAGLALVISLSCNAKYPNGPESSQNVGLEVQYVRLTSDPNVGDSVGLVAYSVDSDGAWKEVTTEVTWLAANTAVVRPVGTPGRFVALSVGSTDAIASYGGRTGSVRVTVVPPTLFPRIEFSNATERLDLGKTGYTTVYRTETLGAVPRGVSSEATWASSNPAVSTATVDNQFEVRFSALSIGTARLTATHGGLSKTLNISVAPRR